LISSDIVKIHQVKDLVRRANIITKFFKCSTLAASWLKDAIDLKNIQGGGLKTYVETRWTTVYECTHSIWRLKDALQYVKQLFVLLFNKLMIKINYLTNLNFY
jgi:hypothetical protein